MSDNNILIKRFERSNRKAVRLISCDTAFLGIDNKLFFDDDEVLADALTIYYTDYEPQSCFVAVEKNKVIGYIIGSKNVVRMDMIFHYIILPKLIIKALARGVFLRKKNIRFLLRVAGSFLKGEFSTPDFSKQYPATLHINIDENFRGRKIGNQLIEHYLKYLKENKIGGVHFGTMSGRAKNFFTRLGFNILFETRHSYLTYITKQDIHYYILGKTL